MLLSAGLLLLAAAAVTSQDKQCIPNAQWSALTKRCECNAGYTGQGDLCCYKPAVWKSCHVAGDPVLTSFTNDKMGLDFPCGTSISSVTIRGKCRVNVYAASRETASGGVYYSSRVAVQLRHPATGSSRTYTFKLAGTPSVIINFQGANIPVTLTDGVNSVPTYGVTNGKVIIDYNAALGLITFFPCGQVITMRLVSDDQVQQERTPGLCVVVPRGARPNFSTKQMCSLNQNMAAQGKSAYLNYLIKPMERYIQNDLALTKVNDPSYRSQCSKFQVILRGCHLSDRASALKKCAFLLFQGTVKLCVSQVNKPMQQGASFSAFVACINTYCDGQKDSCNAFRDRADIKSCAPTLTNCHTWMPYRRNNRVIAGEGEDQSLTQGELQGLDNDGELVNTGDFNNNNDQGDIGGFDGFNPDDLGFKK